jgi:hypothetical protein
MERELGADEKFGLLSSRPKIIHVGSCLSCKALRTLSGFCDRDTVSYTQGVYLVESRFAGVVLSQFDDCAKD